MKVKPLIGRHIRIGRRSATWESAFRISSTRDNLSTGDSEQLNSHIWNKKEDQD